MKTNFKNFFKKTVAKVLAVAMTLSTFAGGVVPIAHAEDENVRVLYRDDFIQAVTSYASVPYLANGDTLDGCDSTGLLKLTLMNMFGTTMASFADDGTTFDITNINSLPSDIADRVAAGNADESSLRNRATITGNGFTMNFLVARALLSGVMVFPNYADVDYNESGINYSSRISFYQASPGTIINYNGGTAFGLGRFINDTDVIKEYPNLENSNITYNFDSAAEAWGDAQPDRPLSDFGNTSYLTISSKTGGAVVSNLAYTGDVDKGVAEDALHKDLPIVVFVIERPPQTHDVKVHVVNTVTSEEVKNTNILFDVFPDAECLEPRLNATDLNLVFDDATGEAKAQPLPRQNGYLKLNDASLPTGFTADGPIYLDKNTGERTLYITPMSYAPSIAVNDQYAGTPLSGSELKLFEYDNTISDYTEVGTLLYSPASETFILNQYTNNDSVTFTGDSVYYTDRNEGKFRVQETTAQNGYDIGMDTTRDFDVTNNPSITGIRNKMKLRLAFQGKGTDDVALSGATVTVKDVNGNILAACFMGTDGTYNLNLLDNGKNSIKLVQSSTMDGYVIPDDLKEENGGREYPLNKTVLTEFNPGEYAFVTDVQFVNAPYVAPVYDGKIEINAVDNYNHPVENATYNVFTDSSCTTSATDASGNPVAPLTTDVSGKQTTPDMSKGSYYFELTGPVDTYAFPAGVGSATVEGSEENQTTPATMPTFERQKVVLNLTHTDDYDTPIEGVVYEVRLNTTEHDIVNAELVNDDLLVGYFKTDSNGVITIDKFGTSAFDDNGIHYNDVNVMTKGGSNITGDPLFNGTYTFIEKSIPGAYVGATSDIIVDATYESNIENKENVINNKTVSAYGKTLTASTNTKSSFGSAVINVSIVDNTYNSTDGYKHYLDSESVKTYYFNSLNTNVAAYSTIGVAADVYTIGDIVNPVDGSIIPTGTKIASVPFGANGLVSISNMTEAPYAGQDLPSGTYEIRLSGEPVGYTFVSTVDVVNTMNNTDVEFRADIKNTTISVNKTDKNTDENIPGIVFDIYPAIALLANGLTESDLTDRDAVMNVASTLSLTIQKTTDENGEFSATLPYGAYVLVEKDTPSSAKYEKIAPIYVEPSDSGSFVPVENVNTEFKVIIKNEDLDGNPIDGNSFTLSDSNGTIGTNQTVAGQVAFDNELPYGEYTISQDSAQDGFLAVGPIVLKVDATGETAVLASDDTVTFNVVKALDANGFWTVTVTVPNGNNELGVIVKTNNGTNDVDVIGAEMALVDESDVEIATWTTVDEPTKDDNGLSVHKFTGIPAGNYKIVQKVSPAGLATAAPVNVTLTATTLSEQVVVENKPIVVTIATVDGISGKPLPGVVVELLDATGNVVATFDDENATQERIPAGTYTLNQITTPDGYQKPATPVVIVVQDVETPQEFLTNAVDGNNVPLDNRTYGTLSIVKKDSVDGKLLSGVVFELKDKATGALIETLTTDDNGEAEMTVPMPIGTYADDGTFAPIEYMLEEVTPPVGQYVLNTDISTIVFDYEDDTTQFVTKQLEIVNDRPNIVITTNTTPQTLQIDEEGNPLPGFEYLTSVKNGDTITHTITVTNNGTASGKNIVVRDGLPAGLVFEASDGTYDSVTNTVYWPINELNVGETKTLTLTAKVEVDKPSVLVNDMSYFVPDDVNYVFDKDDTTIIWTKLPSSKINVPMWKAENQEEDRLVAAFDRIHFVFTFSSIESLPDLKITDVIPDGLTYVPDSAVINGQPDATATYNPDTKLLTFTTPTSWTDETSFEFDVTVDYIPAGQRLNVQNKATLEYTANKYTGEMATFRTATTTIHGDAMMELTVTAEPETHIGTFDESLINSVKDVTVLKKDDKVTFNFTVKNNGESNLRRIQIVDAVPTGFKIEEVLPDDPTVLAAISDNNVIFFASQIAPDAEMTFTIKASVIEQKASLFDNVAVYDLVKTLPVISEGTLEIATFEDTAQETKDVLYQVVEFHKTAEVKDKSVTDGVVGIGDTLIYTLEAKAGAPVNGAVISDALPVGVTFVPDSAQMQLADSNGWVPLRDSVVYDETTRTVTFSTSSDESSDLALAAGSNLFRFSVTVDRIGTNNANPDGYNKAEFINDATLQYRATPKSTNRESLTSESVKHMAEISISGGKIGSTNTYQGPYDDRNHVTVVTNDDTMKFEITVENKGASALTDVVVQDAIPDGCELVASEGSEYTENNGVLTWVVKSIPAGEKATVSFTVKVAAEKGKPVEIVNIAKYAVPQDIDNIKESEWFETNAVVYQVIAITHSSSVAGGTSVETAKPIEIGTELTYTITVENLDDIYGLTLSDKIPAGMSYVENSAKIVKDGGEAQNANCTFDSNSNTLTFEKLDEIKAGKTEISFKIKVEDTDQYDTDVIFSNQPEITVKANSDSDKTIQIKVDPIVHKATKTNGTDTPKLGLETTNASVVWGFISVVAILGIGVFGYFGFVAPYKKKDD